MDPKKHIDFFSQGSQTAKLITQMFCTDLPLYL